MADAVWSKLLSRLCLRYHDLQGCRTCAYVCAHSYACVISGLLAFSLIKVNDKMKQISLMKSM